MIKTRKEIFKMGKKLKTNITDQIRMMNPDQMVAFIKYFRDVSILLDLSTFINFQINKSVN